MVAKKEGTEMVAVEKASWAGGGAGQPKAGMFLPPRWLAEPGSKEPAGKHGACVSAVTKSPGNQVSCDTFCHISTVQHDSEAPLAIHMSDYNEYYFHLA